MWGGACRLPVLLRTHVVLSLRGQVAGGRVGGRRCWPAPSYPPPPPRRRGADRVGPGRGRGPGAAADQQPVTLTGATVAAGVPPVVVGVTGQGGQRMYFVDWTCPLPLRRPRPRPARAHKREPERSATSPPRRAASWPWGTHLAEIARSRDAAMATAHEAARMQALETYNYLNFSFVLEAPEIERWLQAGPRTGDPAPDFELDDLDGEPVPTGTRATAHARMAARSCRSRGGPGGRRVRAA
jgi:hypothetical protein